MPLNLQNKRPPQRKLPEDSPERSLVRRRRKSDSIAPGTIAHILHSHRYSNEDVYNYLQSAWEDRPQDLKWIRKLLDNGYHRLGPMARERPSVWDELCYKFHIPPSIFVGVLSAAIYQQSRAEALLYNARTERVIAREEEKVIASLARRAAEEEFGVESTRLFLETSKRIGGEKGITVQTQVNVQSGGERTFPLVEDTTRDALRQVREEQQRLLEGVVEGEVLSPNLD